MRAAAALLSSSRSVGGLADVLRATGLAGEPEDLDAQTRSALGLEEIPRAELAPGPGLFRVLLVQLDHGASLRESLQRLARRLSSRAPQVLWVVAAVDARGDNAAIAGV
jgi:hypothetical protein